MGIVKGVKKYLNRLFIDGLSGMALGLFSTLIIGTIIKQIGTYIPGTVGNYLTIIGMVAQVATGAGIGCGVACKLKQQPLVMLSSAVCGFIGASASTILNSLATLSEGETLKISISGPGDPLNAFIAAYVGIEIGRLVAGKTKVDIVVTPFVTIVSGGAVALLAGPYISDFTNWLGSLINVNVEAHPFIGGIIVSVLMGIFLTLPISSAAIGVALGLSGITAGAATVGCCANMIGFAVISYRENKMGGLIAQGVGTSMLQMPNIVKKPIIWLPAIISSAVIAPLSTMVFKMQSNPVGSGMGTAGLVGPISTFSVMTENGTAPWIVLGEIALVYFVLPAAISLFVSESMRKLGWIKNGDMKLDV